MASTITYEDALATLQSMFSSLDRSVLSLVLRQNRGHMEKTVEALLAMTSGKDPNAGLPVQPTTKRSRKSRRRRALQRAIAEDFLRPPSFFRKSHKQEKEDHVLAQFLQDQMIMQAMRQNPELFEANRGMRGQGRTGATTGVNRDRPAKQEGPAPVAASSEEKQSEDMNERVKNLPAAQKRKLGWLARLFRRNKESKKSSDAMYMSLPSLEMESMHMDRPSEAMDSEDEHLQDPRFENLSDEEEEAAL